MTYKRNVAHFRGAVGVEEAEGLLAWLQQHENPKLNLADCTHLHAAQLQVLMAARAPIAAWPRNESLARWLMAALAGPGTGRSRPGGGVSADQATRRTPLRALPPPPEKS